MKNILFALTFISLITISCNDDDKRIRHITTAGYRNDDRGSLGSIAVWNDDKLDLDVSGQAIISSGVVDGNDTYHGGSDRNGFLPTEYLYVKPSYWKNGVRTILADYGNVTAITVVNGDVYCAGYITSNNIKTYVYWKNTTMTPIETLGDTNLSMITVQGNDVYVLGLDEGRQFEDSEGSVTTIWMNGKERYGFNIGDKGSAVAAIAFKGTVLYAAGITAKGPFIWNDTEHQFTKLVPKDNDSNFYYPTAIVLVGDDVYVAATKKSVIDSTSIGAGYWKNEDHEPIGSLTHAAAIKVNGSDVYLLGHNYNEPHPPAIWRKNEPQIIFETQFSWTYTVFDFSVHP